MVKLFLRDHKPPPLFFSQIWCIRRISLAKSTLQIRSLQMRSVLETWTTEEASKRQVRSWLKSHPCRENTNEHGRQPGRTSAALVGVTQTEVKSYIIVMTLPHSMLCSWSEAWRKGYLFLRGIKTDTTESCPIPCGCNNQFLNFQTVKDKKNLSVNFSRLWYKCRLSKNPQLWLCALPRVMLWHTR